MKFIKFPTQAQVAAALLLAAGVASAASVKSYQVTGPIVEINETSITVEKGKGEKWVIARAPETKVEGGELKPGAKVTVYYTMSAASIEVKGDTKAEKKKK